MPSPVLTENWTRADFLVSAARGTQSQDVIIFDNSGGSSAILIPAGSPFSFSGLAPATVTPQTGNVGTGTIAGVAANPLPIMFGNYGLVMTSPNAFSVTAPDGTPMQTGSIGKPYADGVEFVLAAGSIPFAAGDLANIAIGGSRPVATFPTGNTGNGTFTGLALVESAIALPGTYFLNFISPTTFTVFAPDGRELPQGQVGVPYLNAIAFTIAAGMTAFAAGDALNISFAAGSNFATRWTGAEPAAGVTYEPVYIPAFSTAKVVAIVREAEVTLQELQFAFTISAAGLATLTRQLKALGVLCR